MKNCILQEKVLLIETNTIIVYDVFALGSRCNSNLITHQFFLVITFYSLSLSHSACHAVFSNVMLSEVIKAKHIY